MKLDEWLLKAQMTQTDLAAALNVYPSQVHNILKGRHQPKPDMAKRIRQITNFSVTLDDIYDIPSHEEQVKNKTLKESTECFKAELENSSSDIFEMMCDKLFDLIKEKIDEKKESLQHSDIA